MSSAGRVQSVALRIICDREDEINAFIPEEYWTLDAELSVKGERKTLLAKFYGDENGKLTISSKEQADRIMAEMQKEEFHVLEVKKGERVKKAPLPFTTSTLQQEASKALNFPISKTMRIAQQLYEGVDVKGQGTVGLITYLRTDSVRISEEADAQAREYIDVNYGENYIAGEKTTKKNGAKIQDAHEAIRPSDINRTPVMVKESLSRDQFRLYQLIWKRFTASRMQPAIYETTSVKSAVNTGYWGMAVEAGKNYNLEFYVRAEETPGCRVAIITSSGRTVAQKEIKLTADGQWHRYTATFTPSVTGDDCSLNLVFPPKGQIWLDYVSLFPQDTFKGRPNGLRKDVATAIEQMHPAFIRWPGGCIVEGLTLENRVKWKETIGDPVKRPGEYNLWGYRSTYGFGYHEFLQYCEDSIHSDAMFVCNAGMACLFRNGDYVQGDELEPLIQEALDAIEYAIGDAKTTKWGAERAKNGHPEPFPLKYIEVGNENVFSRYAENYNRFHKAIKAKYPQLTVLTALPYLEKISFA